MRMVSQYLRRLSIWSVENLLEVTMEKSKMMGHMYLIMLFHKMVMKSVL